MPGNTLPDPSLMFLYLCIINSDFSKINFAAVGAATGLKPSAASMRWYRLKKVLETGIVDGKNAEAAVGTPGAEGLPAADGEGEGEDAGASITPSGTSSATPSPQKKRKVNNKAATKGAGKKGKGKGRVKTEGMDGDMEGFGDDDVLA
ncbi:hypothetical protein BDW59DRAFT_159249 [Aspergillus cavernicola]|uniref:Myb-like DNA-binding domain-containing protein n=1 Tax=Aspergillus cavernicola TaxID=176166 RepID=A0ABR4IR22_9EURO